MLDSTVYGVHACAHVESPNGTFAVKRGFTTCVKNGVGDYTLTMAVEVDTNRSIVQATIQDQGGDASRRNITVQTLNNSQIRVRTFRVGAASDEHFWIEVREVSPD